MLLLGGIVAGPDGKLYFEMGGINSGFVNDITGFYNENPVLGIIDFVPATKAYESSESLSSVEEDSLLPLMILRPSDHSWLTGSGTNIVQAAAISKNESVVWDMLTITNFVPTSATAYQLATREFVCDDLKTSAVN